MDNGRIYSSAKPGFGNQSNQSASFDQKAAKPGLTQRSSGLIQQGRNSSSSIVGKLSVAQGVYKGSTKNHSFSEERGTISDSQFSHLQGSFENLNSRVKIPNSEVSKKFSTISSQSSIHPKNADWTNILSIDNVEFNEENIDRMPSFLHELSLKNTGFPSDRVGRTAENFPGIEAGPSVLTQSVFETYAQWNATQTPHALERAFVVASHGFKEKNPNESALARAKKLQIFGRVCCANNALKRSINLILVHKSVAALEEAVLIYQKYNPPYTPHSDDPRLINGYSENNAMGLQSGLKDICYALLQLISGLKQQEKNPSIEQDLVEAREKLLTYTKLATSLIYTSHGRVQTDAKAYRFEQGEIVFYEEKQSVGTMGIYDCIVADFHLKGTTKKAAVHYDSHASDIDSLKIIDERMPPGEINVRLVGAMFGPGHVNSGWVETSQRGLTDLLNFLYRSKRRFNITSAAIHNPLQPQDVVFGPEEKMTEAIATRFNPDMVLGNQWCCCNDGLPLKPLHVTLDLTLGNGKLMSDKRLPRLIDLKKMVVLTIAAQVWQTKDYERLYDFIEKNTLLNFRIPSTVGGYLEIIDCYWQAIELLKEDMYQTISKLFLTPSHEEIKRIITIIEAHSVYIGRDLSMVKVANQSVSSFIKTRLFASNKIDYEGLQAVKV